MLMGELVLAAEGTELGVVMGVMKSVVVIGAKMLVGGEFGVGVVFEELTIVVEVVVAVVMVVVVVVVAVVEVVGTVVAHLAVAAFDLPVVVP